ncbi:hypothetical protein, partial [Streptomyces sp. NPDC090056]|uniref:hypothetical protein n=1 Tax=Streptomyces sp. NPDC090056 TaxID=3365934 RepID=UPI0038305B3E
MEHGEQGSTARSCTRSAGRYAGGRAGHHHTDRRRCPVEVSYRQGAGDEVAEQFGEAFGGGPH